MKKIIIFFLFTSYIFCSDLDFTLNLGNESDVRFNSKDYTSKGSTGDLLNLDMYKQVNNYYFGGGVSYQFYSKIKDENDNTLNLSLIGIGIFSLSLRRDFQFTNFYTYIRTCLKSKNLPINFI